MKDEKETKEQLLLCAKKEFLGKGYIKASLRNICRNAGFTTGALYFFFKDKEDLFAALVKKPLDDLYNLMMKHYNDEIELIHKGIIKKDDYLDDFEAARQVVHYMYQHHDECELILTKSQGSCFENSIDKFVSITEKHYYKLITDKIVQRGNAPEVDNYIIHWVAHMNINVFVHLITHETSEEEALKHTNIIIKYLISGWNGML